MIKRIIIAGSGGQGIMLLGKILSEAIMREDKQVTWLPAYGPEVRGGTAHCCVVASDEEISSPWVSEADILIVMNSASAVKFKSRLKSNGLFIANSSLVKQGIKYRGRLLKVPFTDIAIKLGNIRVANIVALGVLIAQTKIASLKTVSAVIEDIAPKDKKDLVEINKRALKEGFGVK